MGNWKDDLKKLKSKLPSDRDDKLVKPAQNAEPSEDVQHDMEWKKGVRPLKQRSKTVQKKRVKRKKLSAKTSNKQPKHQPSMAAIQAAYGGKKVSPKQPQQQKKTPQPVLPDFDDLPQVILTQVSEFKDPDAWVKAGAALQVADGGAGRILRVRMGIDFGTCYTKLTLRAADKVFFVDWDGLRNSNQHYYLPGELSQCGDGSSWLGRHPEAVETFGGLKIPFLSSSYGGKQDTAASIAYIAWVMRYARAWLFKHQELLVKNRRLAWEVNIGSPSDPWCSESLKNRYKDSGLRAWKLSQFDGNISLSMAAKLCVEEGLTPEMVGLDDLHVVPEFVAQIAGYVKSPQRQDGLHLLVDVGAGTMDAVVFNIFRKPKSNIDRFPIFSGEVKPLGTHILMSERLSAQTCKKNNWEDLGGIPTYDELTSDFGLDSKGLMRVDERFSNWVRQSVGKILTHTKRRRYPRAQEWKKGMRVFLTGGGATCDVYRYGIALSFRSLGTQPLFTNFPILDSAARQLGEEGFHRVSVAFGLSYDAETIGKTIRPQEIEDIPRSSQKREMPDRDELYPK